MTGGMTRRLVGGALALLVSAPCAAQTFPVRAQAIVDALYEREQALAHSPNEDDRRALTRRMAEQVRHELGETWGTKASSPMNPPSKDALAQKQPDGKLFAWDWQNGATRLPQRPPLFYDITGQHFIAVNPVNHLAAVPRPVPTPEPSPPAPDLTVMLQQIRDLLGSVARQVEETRTSLEQRTDRMQAGLEVLASRPLGVPLRGSIFGVPVVLRPEMAR